MIIYKVTNKINKKVYIGQTVNSLDHRMEQHYRSSKRNSYYFHNALKKYRIGDFKWEIVCWCDSLEQLNLMEELLIATYDSTNKNKGYNLKKGGLGGGKCCDSTKQKIGATSLIKWQNPKIAEKMRTGLRKATDIWIEKCKNNFILKKCPHCQKEFKVKPYETKTFCNIQCAKKYAKQNNTHMIGLDKANETNRIIRNQIKKEKQQLIYKWVKENQSLLVNVKFNNLAFLKNLCVYLDVKDVRTAAKFLDLSNRKDLAKKLLEISKNICCTGPN